MTQHLKNKNVKSIDLCNTSISSYEYVFKLVRKLHNQATEQAYNLLPKYLSPAFYNYHYFVACKQVIQMSTPTPLISYVCPTTLIKLCMGIREDSTNPNTTTTIYTPIIRGLTQQPQYTHPSIEVYRLHSHKLIVS
jgi:hypothetical protein